MQCSLLKSFSRVISFVCIMIACNGMIILLNVFLLFEMNFKKGGTALYLHCI